MCRNILFLLLAMGLVCSVAASPDPSLSKQKKLERIPADKEVADLSGYYVCKGKDGEKTYSGIVVLTKQKEVYLIHWSLTGGSTFMGIAIRKGNTLAASWSMPDSKAGIMRGINMYEIQAGPYLAGQWSTLPGNGTQQTENLKFLKRLEEDDD